MIKNVLTVIQAQCHCVKHGCIYIFFWIPYWPRMLINILWPPLDAN